MDARHNQTIKLLRACVQGGNIGGGLMFKVFLSAIAAVVTLSAQTDSFDVRHLKWGMTKAQIAEAEPTLKQELLALPVASLRDTIAGIDSCVIFDFRQDKLAGVTFTPWDESSAGSYDTRHPRKDLEYTVYTWFTSLSKKYGQGYVFLGDEQVGKRIDLEGWRNRVALFFVKNSSFHVQFKPNSATVVLLSASYQDKPFKGHYVDMEFGQLSEDNF